MRILITGGEGFIGKHLRRELSHRGHEITSVDKESGDFTEPGVIRSLIVDSKPELVIHLAAQVGRLFGEDDLTHTVKSNALMTTMVANACKDAGCRLLYTSTSEVYGDQGEAECFEDGPLKLSHNLYGVTKFWGEQVAALYAEHFNGLQVIRLSMPYGPGMLPGRGRAAIINMLWQANTGQEITVHRGAERAWCWVADTARGIADVVERGEVARHADDWQKGIGIYNIGRSDNPVSMTRIAELACEITGGSTSLIRVVDPPAMQTVVKRLSNDKLVNSLGWRPTIEVEGGMMVVFESVKYFDEFGVWYRKSETFEEVVDRSMKGFVGC